MSLNKLIEEKNFNNKNGEFRRRHKRRKEEIKIEVTNSWVIVLNPNVAEIILNVNGLDALIKNCHSEL